MFLNFDNKKIINLNNIRSIFLYESKGKYIICFESNIKNIDQHDNYDYDYEFNFKTEQEALTYFAKLKSKLNFIEINWLKF